MKTKKHKHFHQIFVPHRGNKFHPVALRPIGLAVFLLLYISIPLLYNLSTAGKFQVLGYATNISTSALHSLTNQERTANGVAQLRLNTQLSAAAQAKANHMIQNDYWAHVSPSGVTPWTFVANAGYDYQTAGENLAKGFSTSSGVVSGWMNSSSHRANMLSSSYSDVGFAILDGVLQGSETTLVVAFYAEPYVEASAPPTQPQPSSQPAPQPQEPVPAPPAPESEDSAPTPTEEEVPPEPEEEPAELIEQTEQTQAEDEPPSAITSSNRGNDGSVAGIYNFAIAQQYVSLNWGQRASILLVSTLMLLFIMKHTLIWREQKRGFRHIWLRSHPLGQAMLLISVLALTILSSIGVVL